MANLASPTESRVPVWLRVIIGQNPLRTLLRAAVLALVLWVVFQYLLLPRRVQRESMTPTIREGAVVLINRLAYMFSEPKRGDIVGVRTTGNDVLYLKRIIGLPNEELAIKGGKVFIDGEVLEEPYLKNGPGSWNVGSRQLGQGEYFLIGDNRIMPASSHSFGSTAREKIIGRAIKLLPGSSEADKKGKGKAEEGSPGTTQ